jgi:predicted transport protein
MSQFIFSNNKLTELQLVPFQLEREIQTLCEKNMEKLLNLTFTSSEFAINSNFRIDSLAFDKENNSFVIIEYKMKETFSIIDQGYAYLSIMLDNKAEFILEYNEKLGKHLRREDVDWSQSKIIFISPDYNKFQLETLNFNDVPFEAYKISKFEDNYISFERIKGNKSVSIKPVINSQKIDKVNKEIRIYTEEDHLKKTTKYIIDLYNSLKEKSLELGEIDVEPKKLYIAFKGEKNIFDITILNKSLKIFINLKKGELDDPKKLTKDISQLGHWGNGDYEIRIDDFDYLEYVMFLIKQSWYKNKK